MPSQSMNGPVYRHDFNVIISPCRRYNTHPPDKAYRRTLVSVSETFLFCLVKWRHVEDLEMCGGDDMIPHCLSPKSRTGRLSGEERQGGGVVFGGNGEGWPQSIKDQRATCLSHQTPNPQTKTKRKPKPCH